jgi:hypothetical protein
VLYDTENIDPMQKLNIHLGKFQSVNIEEKKAEMVLKKARDDSMIFPEEGFKG